jgi:GH25 family lysozyme M1 (1,4-beta-N-acetylmuramidase)
MSMRRHPPDARGGRFGIVAGVERVPGIDVSAYQQPPFTAARIDWPAVAASGKRFAIIKATEGSRYVNPHFERDRRLADASGLIVGSYHFGRWEPTPGVSVVDDARAEVAHYARTVGSVPAGELPPTLDLEWITGKKIDPDALVLWTRTFLEECERLFGRWPMLYTGPSFWRYCLLPDKRDLSLELTSWPLWIVDYTPTDGEPDPMRDARAWRWSIWQTTGHGSCPGVEGKCDLNVARDLATLRELAGLDPTEAP